MTQLLDGCSFCHSKFKLEDFTNKISSFNIRRDAMRRVTDIMFKSIIAAIVLFILATIIGFFYGLDSYLKSSSSFIFALIRSLGSGLLIGTITMMCTLAVIALPAFFIIYLKEALFLIQGVGKTQSKGKFELAARKHDPLFSLENFLGNMENKLAAIHFASKYKEVATFVHSDITRYIQDYANVINCTLGDIHYTSYQVNEHHQIAQLDVKLCLLILKKQQNYRTKRKPVPDLGKKQKYAHTASMRYHHISMSFMW